MAGASPFDNIYFRLPPATAALLFSAAFALTSGHALPRQTKVVAYHELDVIPFPIPTSGPLSPSDLRRRQDNTICGYLGGDTALPATCSAGSHCVLDPLHSVVGCCPNGDACTTGVFTGCVDSNSGPQTELNPYVFTCSGSNVCFQNQFAGGFSQYGCGTASSLGTTVQTSVADASSTLDLITSEVSLTESATSLATPTSIGSSSSSQSTATASSSSSSSPTAVSSSSSATSSVTRSGSSSRSTSTSKPTSSSTSSKSSTRTSSSSKSSSESVASSTPSSSSATQTETSTTTTPPATTSSSSPAPPASPAHNSRNAAIVGGTIGGAAALISLISLILFCVKRRRDHNPREGPGPTPAPPPTTEYISPARSHGAAFAPLPGWHDDDGGIYAPYHQGNTPDPYGPLEPPGAVAAAPANFSNHSHGFSQPLRYNPSYMAGGSRPGAPKGGLTPVAEEEHPLEAPEPPGREIDDFSRAYSNARIGQIPEGVDEDRTPLRNHAQEEEPSIPDLEDSPPRRRGSRPLWQQNRQQSRNLMWL